VDELAQRQPAVEIYRYEADHGFNCDVRASYDPESSRVALERTLEFFRRHVG
jgi:carboxymethylenebutenolidase